MGNASNGVRIHSFIHSILARLVVEVRKTQPNLTKAIPMYTIERVDARFHGIALQEVK
jgi:hypothetical protein